MPFHKKCKRSKDKLDLVDSENLGENILKVPEISDPVNTSIKTEPDFNCELERVGVSSALIASFGLLPSQRPIQDLAIKEEPPTSICELELGNAYSLNNVENGEVVVLKALSPDHKQRTIEFERDLTVTKNFLHREPNVPDTARIVKIKGNLTSSAKTVKKATQTGEKIVTISEFSVENVEETFHNGSEEINDVLWSTNVINEGKIPCKDVEMLYEKEIFHDEFEVTNAVLCSTKGINKEKITRKDVEMLYEKATFPNGFEETNAVLCSTKGINKEKITCKDVEMLYEKATFPNGFEETNAVFCSPNCTKTEKTTCKDVEILCVGENSVNSVKDESLDFEVVIVGEFTDYKGKKNPAKHETYVL